MNILHLYDSKDILVARHVALLQQNDTTNDVRTAAGGGYMPDIVHLHGCWHHGRARQAMQLQRRGARLVLTPHHQLQPWATAHHRLDDKWPKMLLWQRRLCAGCYCMIASGQWELQVLRQLGWTPRIEHIADAAITQELTARDMARRMAATYRKVMDSHPAALLSAEAWHLLPCILKAGVSGDRRWVDMPAQQLNELGNALSSEDWRHLYIYAFHSGLADIFSRGLDLLQLQSVPVDARRIPIYLPQPKKPETKDVRPAEPQDAEPQYRQATDITALLLDIRRATALGRLSFGLLADMVCLLRQPQLNEDKLMADLRRQRLAGCMAALLPLLAETMLLEEGFMPCAPTDNRLTSAMRRALQHHLAI